MVKGARILAGMLMILELRCYAYDHTIALVAIFQNEAAYLQEWIEFHKLVGVEKFYLYNNMSTDNYQQVLQPYLNQCVELIDWPFDSLDGDHDAWIQVQVSAYNHCINRVKGKVKWLAVLDTDEFLFPVVEDVLGDFLASYDNCGALCVNWQEYGTSNIQEWNSDMLVIENFVFKGRENNFFHHYVKSIVRPECVRCFKNPHVPIMFRGKACLTSDYQTVLDLTSACVSIDKIRINHYWTRHQKYFDDTKIARRIKHGFDIQFLQKRAALDNVKLDTVIHKYLPRLRKILVH